MPSRFIDIFKKTITDNLMLLKGDKLQIGISGGSDSVSLLYALLQIRDEYDLDLCLTHLDHNLRGKESDGDREFCEKLARSNSLEFHTKKIDVKKLAKERSLCIEEAARFARYEFFKEISKKYGMKKIALGHNMNDQAETVLMRFLRGSGLSGLGGMNPVNEMKGLIVIRPLIDVSRGEIELFLKEKDIKARHDSSNDSLEYTRNKVRHELIPTIEKEFNSNLKKNLINTAENIREENLYLEKMARRKFKTISKIINKDEIKLDLKKFKKLHIALKKRVFRHTIEELKGDLRRLTYQHWKELSLLLKDRPTNSIVDLPQDINIIKTKSYIVFKKM